MKAKVTYYNNGKQVKFVKSVWTGTAWNRVYYDGCGQEQMKRLNKVRG